MSVRLSRSSARRILPYSAASLPPKPPLPSPPPPTSPTSKLRSPMPFAKTNPIVSVRFVTGASAMLSQQIENGAPYDVFLSANAQFIDRLASFRKLAA